MPSQKTLEILASIETLPGPPEYDEFWDGINFLYFDREGEPITLRQWMTLFELFEDYRLIAKDYVGPYHVSTIWTGLDRNVKLSGDKNYRPTIFESMIFKNGTSLDERSYSTEEEALLGHKDMIETLYLKF